MFGFHAGTRAESMTMPSAGPLATIPDGMVPAEAAPTAEGAHDRRGRALHPRPVADPAGHPGPRGLVRDLLAGGHLRPLRRIRTKLGTVVVTVASSATLPCR